MGNKTWLLRDEYKKEKKVYVKIIYVQINFINIWFKR